MTKRSALPEVGSTGTRDDAWLAYPGARRMRRVRATMTVPWLAAVGQDGPVSSTDGEVMTMGPTLFLTVGLPGTGKATEARRRVP